MSDILVRVDDVGKKFCRSLKQSLWYGARDMAAAVLGSEQIRNTLRQNEFWANRGISFSLKRGEAIGLIGHNGAGKTTLLRMLNGLIRPDTGRIEIHGRMQALIALGAGFNPVLTGRENVYVNAAVLGYSRKETNQQLDSIIEFADIGEFIDAPVQSYSSGMVVRLGFAVAAHMDPDVLLVDEVLAVGDANFRRKCFKKIREFREAGTGIILVTHDISQVYNVCDSAILLDHGQVRSKGKLDQVVEAYWEINGRAAQSRNTPGGAVLPASSEAHLTGASFNGKPIGLDLRIRTGASLNVGVQFKVDVEVSDIIIGVALAVPGGGGSYITAINSRLSGFKIPSGRGAHHVECIIPSMPLYPGHYELVVTLNDAYGGRYDGYEGESAIRFTVDPGMIGGGDTYMHHAWHVINQ